MKFTRILTTAALAQGLPKILSVTPSTAHTAGGTSVTVMGEGFLHSCGPITCPPNEIRFGCVPAFNPKHRNVDVSWDSA